MIYDLKNNRLRPDQEPKSEDFTIDWDGLDELEDALAAYNAQCIKMSPETPSLWADRDGQEIPEEDYKLKYWVWDEGIWVNADKAAYNQRIDENRKVIAYPLTASGQGKEEEQESGIEQRGIALVRLLKENTQLKQDIEQMKTNEYYLRCSWDETIKERDELKKQLSPVPELPNLSISTSNLSQIGDKDEWMREVRREGEINWDAVIEDVLNDRTYRNKGLADKLRQKYSPQPAQPAGQDAEMVNITLERVIRQRDELQANYDELRQKYDYLVAQPADSRAMDERIKEISVDFFWENKDLVHYNYQFIKNRFDNWFSNNKYFNHQRPVIELEDTAKDEEKLMEAEAESYAQAVHDQMDKDSFILGWKACALYVSKQQPTAKELEEAAMDEGEKQWDLHSTRVPEDSYNPEEEYAEMVAGKDIMFKSDFDKAVVAIIQSAAAARYHYPELVKEIEQLKRWKKEAIAVMPDYQAIGKAIGVPLGQSVHDKILPEIERLRKELALTQEEWKEKRMLLEDQIAKTVHLQIGMNVQQDTINRLQSQLSLLREQEGKFADDLEYHLIELEVMLSGVKREELNIPDIRRNVNEYLTQWKRETGAGEKGGKG